MNIENSKIKVNDLEVEIVRKNIKNIHLGVYPPDGRVRVAVPIITVDERVRLMIITKISWIRKQQEKYRSQVRQSQREYVSGESHYLWGKRYLLNIVYHKGTSKVVIRNKKYIDLYIREGATREQRESAMLKWYRQQLKEQIPSLIVKWEEIMGVKVEQWAVKKMKTKWGTCNINAKRVWFNLHLVKKPPNCLEYVVVHEMVHLLERTHNARFVALMNKYYPNWLSVKEQLNIFMLDFFEEFEY